MDYDLLLRAFLLLNAVPFLAVGAQALRNPQTVMDLVATPLPNSDARSSITGSYGGIPVVLAAILVYAPIYGVWMLPALVVLLVYTGGYALGRVVAWQRDGTLGPFARKWLMIEAVVAAISVAFVLWQ